MLIFQWCKPTISNLLDLILWLQPQNLTLCVSFSGKLKIRILGYNNKCNSKVGEQANVPITDLAMS